MHCGDWCVACEYDILERRRPTPYTLRYSCAAPPPRERRPKAAAPMASTILVEDLVEALSAFLTAGRPRACSRAEIR